MSELNLYNVLLELSVYYVHLCVGSMNKKQGLQPHQCPILTSFMSGCSFSYIGMYTNTATNLGIYILCYSILLVWIL